MKSEPVEGKLVEAIDNARVYRRPKPVRLKREDSSSTREGRKPQKVAGQARQRHSAEGWWTKLKCNERGSPQDLLANVAVILRSDPAFADALRWDELRAAVVTRQVPWDQATDWREWTDLDDLSLAEWCQLRDVAVKPATCAAAVQVVAAEHPHHPIRQYLHGLEWDGVARLSTWLPTYLGTADTHYTREVGRRFLISAIARVLQPGCKADHALILEGPQGAGKSTAARRLAVSDAWFSDEIADLGSKDSAQDLKGKWIVELAELSAMRRIEIERTKAFISRSVDHYRPSYGRRSQDFPRQCVFIGSTNADAYLADETGARRFWPVKVGKIDLAGLRSNRHQLWAEAREAFEKNETWWLDKATEAIARGEQLERLVSDPWEERVLDWADDQAARGQTVTSAKVLRELGMPTERQNLVESMRVGRILKAAGWTSGPMRRIDRVRARPWLPPKSPERHTSEAGGAMCDTRCDATKPRNSLDISKPVTPVTPVTLDFTHDGYGYEGSGLCPESLRSNGVTPVTGVTVPKSSPYSNALGMSHVERRLPAAGVTGNPRCDTVCHYCGGAIDLKKGRFRLDAEGWAAHLQCLEERGGTSPKSPGESR